MQTIEREYEPTFGGRDDVLVVFSGGQDSTLCLFWALEHYAGTVHAVTFNYGQRHSAELVAAGRIVELAKAWYPEKFGTHEVVNLGPILKGTSPLVSGADLEQYADHASLPGGLEKTFVPMRNQLFLTLAANRAFCLGIDTVVTGVCQEDFGGYPDCRRSFIDRLASATSEGTFTEEAGFIGGFAIETPLMDLTKAESVNYARTAYRHAYTAWAYSHTAYDGRYPPLGHDHANLLRAKGFEEAGVPDPLVVRAALIDYVMPLPDTDNYTSALAEAEIERLLADLPRDPLVAA